MPKLTLKLFEKLFCFFLAMKRTDVHRITCSLRNVTIYLPNYNNTLSKFILIWSNVKVGLKRNDINKYIIYMWINNWYHKDSSLDPQPLECIISDTISMLIKYLVNPICLVGITLQWLPWTWSRSTGQRNSYSNNYHHHDQSINHSTPNAWNIIYTVIENNRHFNWYYWYQ